MAIPKMSDLSPLAAIRQFSEPAAWAELEQLLGLGEVTTKARDGWTENDWARHDFQVKLKVEAARLRPIEGFKVLFCWGQLDTAFRARLRSGELVATGEVKPVKLAPERTAIPADRWRFLKIDYQKGIASGLGLEVVSILVLDDAPTKSTIAAETACRELIKRKAKTGIKPVNRNSLYDEARTEIGPALSKRAFNRAWASVAPDRWKRPGRKSTRRIDSRSEP